MPLRQYFLWVGSILLAALFAADCWLPAPAAVPHSQIPPRERVNLQIRSNHKWPDRVVFDTTHSGRSSVAEVYPEPELAQPQDLAETEYGARHNALAAKAAAQAPAATDDNASAIPAKPATDMFRMTGTITVD